MVSRIRSSKWGLLWLVPAVLLSLGLFGGTTHAAPLRAQAAYTLNVVTAPSGTMYLADANGKAQYFYTSDTPGSTTLTCTGGCANNWPPLKAQGSTPPTLDPMAMGTIGTVTLADGSVAVTYTNSTSNGALPLYGFVRDQAGAEPTGNNDTVGGATFTLVTP